MKRLLLVLLCVFVLSAGCGKPKQKRNPRASFSDVMVGEWVKDLSSGKASERLKACRELENMGQAAAGAVKKLQQVAQKDKDKRVRAAANKALKAIR